MSDSMPQGKKFAIVAPLILKGVHQMESVYGRIDDLKLYLNSQQLGFHAVSLYVGLICCSGQGYLHDQPKVANHRPDSIKVIVVPIIFNALRHSCKDGENDDILISKVWNELGNQAYHDSADYILLSNIGRVVGINTKNIEKTSWAHFIVEEFSKLTQKNLGCLALLPSKGLPRWKFNIILPSTHFELFGALLPNSNQEESIIADFDRFLYYAYARFNAARVLDGGQLFLLDDSGAHSMFTRSCKGLSCLWSDWLVERMRCGLGRLLVEEVPSLDVVVPTYRVDVPLLKGICSPPVVNQATLTYIIVDNPSKVQNHEMLSSLQRQLGVSKPTLIRVNETNSGVTSSRNRGIEASGADYIILQDDDVIPDKHILQAYTMAIRKHSTDPIPPVGYCGMIHFPEPYNTFTAGIRMSGVTNAFEIAQLSPRPLWGCTANVCMRNGPWLYFTESWEKTGGGEDIDFFLRLRKIGPVVSVPEAAVTHPWWTDGKRSYWHFRMWGLGDGRIQNLYPEYCYRSCPNLVECLFVLWFLFVCTCITMIVIEFDFGYMLHLSSPYTMPPSISTSRLFEYMVFMSLGMIEIDMVGDVLFDRLLYPALNADSLRGWKRDLASMEGSIIKAAGELGRLEYHLCNKSGRFRDLCLRFDFFCGCIPEARRAWKVNYSLKFMGFLIYGIVIQWLATFSPSSLSCWMMLSVNLIHAGLLVFICSLFIVP